MVCADHCARLLNINFSEVANTGEKLAQVLEYAYKLYQYDMVLVFSDPYVEAQALGCPVRLDPFATITGPKTNEGFDRTAEIIRAASILKKRVDVPIFVSVKGPFSLSSFLVGIKDFLKMVLRDDDEVRKTIEQAVAFQLNYIERILRLEVNIFIGDPVASASIISPDVFKRFAYDPLKTLVKTVKEKDLICGIHICGDTKPLMDMLDTIGADFLSIEDITLKTDTLKMGGVLTNTILYGKPPDIREEINIALNEPHLIIATSCDVPVETDPENVKMMVKYASEHCKG